MALQKPKGGKPHGAGVQAPTGEMILPVRDVGTLLPAAIARTYEMLEADIDTFSQEERQCLLELSVAFREICEEGLKTNTKALPTLLAFLRTYVYEHGDAGVRVWLLACEYIVVVMFALLFTKPDRLIGLMDSRSMAERADFELLKNTMLMCGGQSRKQALDMLRESGLCTGPDLLAAMSDNGQEVVNRIIRKIEEILNGFQKET